MILGMPELPSGTVTFLFTDIEGSTRLLQELGDAYAEALAEHRRVLRDAFARHGGVEVDTQGDAFFVAFARASDALAAAGDVREALDGPIRVRMGVHTGEPLVTADGYVGIDVHRAARIAAVGHGGQILVSQSTRDLVGGDSLHDLGEHRLKDLTAPERIYQLGDGDFPPLKSLNATNLPVASSTLVGRERELREIFSLLNDSARLVTLTGTGGTGKTRLALQAAAELVGEFSGGVFFVPLAGVQQPELVRATITSTIGIHELGELRDREALLLLDNFEHLLAAAPAVADLLRSASRVKVLTTSRAPLRVEGEREYPVEPLPDDDALTLLTERARAVRPDFTPDEAAREICTRLDGLPLALELAASRLRSLGAAALLERLDQRLPVLTTGRRDAPERQRTLRATIEWSYDLLAVELQRLFARLGVFATFTLEAAEAVADARLEDVDALVEASLLKPVRGDRFLMLETIREFVLERLAESGDEDELRRRHVAFLTVLAQRANLTVESQGPMRHDLVVPEHNNIRAVLDWAVANGEADLGLHLALALENFWVTAADPKEAIGWIDALLARGRIDPEMHALALRALANCTGITGERRKGIELYEQSLAEFRDLGDELRCAIALHRIATNVALEGELDRARQLNEESIAFYRRSHFVKGEAQCLSLFGDLERRRGAPERALEFYEQSIALCRETGFSWWLKNVLLVQALALFELDRPRDAARSAREALEVAWRMRDRPGIIDGLALTARAAAEEGDDALAGTLWGAIEAEAERAPIPAWQHDRAQTRRAGPGSRGSNFETARVEAHELGLEDAVTLALRSVD